MTDQEKIIEENMKVYLNEIYGGCDKCKNPLCRDGDVCENLEAQFERLLRMGPKYSGVQVRAMKHLEMHLDRGDIICKCGKERGP